MREELLLGSQFGADALTLLFFIAFAAFFFLAPVIGYRPEGRKKIAYALFLLIGYAAMALLQTLFPWLFLIEDRRGGDIVVALLEGLGLIRDRNRLIHIILFVAIVKIVFLLSAMVMFVSGLLRLQLGPSQIVAVNQEPEASARDQTNRR